MSDERMSDERMSDERMSEFPALLNSYHRKMICVHFGTQILKFRENGPKKSEQI